MSSKLDTRVVQVTNVAPSTTKEQLKTLFGFLGRIRDCKLFPPDLQWEMEGPGTDGVWGTTHDGSDQQVAAKVCYVEFEDATSAGVALHLTNTVFIDRALIVVPVMDGKIPDERVAMQLTPQTVARMTPGQPAWPANVVSQLSGTGATQMITTYDPRLNALGLPQYPPLPAMLDAARVEEIRRTVYIGNLDPKTTAENLITFFSQVGEVKYVRMAGDESSRSAYMEFTDQRSVATCLTYNGVMFNGHPVTVSHAKSNISKPLTKSQEATRREIEEAMKKVKEAQSLISAAAGEKSRSRSRSRKRSRSRSRYSRSRSRSRRSRSRSRGRRRRSRSRGRRSRSPRRTSRRSRTRSPRRRRSRSRSGIVVIPAKDRPSRPRRSRTRSPKRRSRTRSPPKRRSRTPPRAYSSRRSRSRSRGRRSLSHSRHRSRSQGKDRSKDKSRDKDRSRDKDDKDAEKKREKEEKRKGSASSRSPSPPTLKREGSAAPHSGDEGSPPAKRYSSGGEPPPLKGHSEDIPDKKPTKTRDRSKSPRSPVRTLRRRSASRSPSRPIRRRSVSPIVKRRSKSRSPRRSRSPRKKKARSRSHSGSRQKAKKEKKRERSRSRDRKEKDKKKKSTKDKKEEKSSRVTRDYDEEEKGFNSGSEREPGSPSQQDIDDNEDRRSPVGRQPDDMDMSD